MKKFVAAALAVLMMSSNVFAASINVTLNDEAVSFDNQQPIIYEGRTLVPLRGVFEKLGYEITWDNGEKAAEFVKDETVVKVKANADKFTVNGTDITLDVPAKIINGSMMLPLRAIGEATGLKVDWDNAAKTVSLKSVNDDISNGNMEFRFDDESGKGSLKPKSETEEATEAVTEAVTETTTKTKLNEIEKKPLTKEEKSNAETYIIYNQTAIFYTCYMSEINDYTEKMNSINPWNESQRADIIKYLEEAIAFNNAALTKLKTIKNIGINGDMINSLIYTINSGSKFYSALLKNYKADVKNIYNHDVRGKLDAYNNSIGKVNEAMGALTDKYGEISSEWNWSYSDLTSEEREAVDEWQRQAGEIIERNLNSDNDFEIIRGKKADKDRATAASNMEKELSALIPPEKCRIDSEILRLAVQLLGQSAEETDENVFPYLSVLVLTFDAAAKSAVGEYYDAFYFD